MINPVTACQLTTFFIGITEVCFISAPVGRCDYCCPLNGTTDIQYKLYTRLNPHKYQVIVEGNVNSIARTNIDLSQPTVIYIMGFSEAVTGPSTVTIKNAYLARGKYNFIAVDWARLIAFPWYLTAVRNTRYMGKRFADFVQFLQEVGIPARTLHVIGFSLGAEAAGFAGKALRRRGIVLGRITGLDPAYPGYALTDSNGHLAKGDAMFVDVLHTNPGVFGFPLPIGDVDFYANPGKWIQPGCWVDELIVNKELSYIYGCSHNRAWRYYAESVLHPLRFPATLCPRWKNRNKLCDFKINGYMGFGARLPMSGKMFLETNPSSPFGRGKYGTVYESTRWHN